MRTSGTEIRNNTSLRRTNDSACLRGNQRLVINLRENCGLDKLRVNQIRHDRYDRFVRIHNRAFGKSVNVAAKMKILEAVKKFIAENFLIAQIVNVRRAEIHVLDVFNDLLKSGENREAARVGVAPIKHVEGNAGIFAAADEISVRHSHFVKIHHHADIAFIKLRHENSSVNKNNPMKIFQSDYSVVAANILQGVRIWDSGIFTAKNFSRAESFMRAKFSPESPTFSGYF